MKWHMMEASGIDRREKSVVNERQSHSKDLRRISLYDRVLPTARNFFRSSVFQLPPRLFALLLVAIKKYLAINA